MIDHRYQVGGSLSKEDLNYVERDADIQIYRALKSGEFCYVLNSRQMGKSSLLVRTKYRLEELDYLCAALDLTGIGSDNVTPEQWYKGIISQLYLGFNLIGKVNLKQWWIEQGDISSIHKLNNFIHDILLTNFLNRQLVIFIDEVDSIFSLPFATDDFFAFIRFCYNRRAIAPEYKRLNFAVFGVATAGSLIADKQRTPFNIGRNIQLTGFILDNSLSLTQGLNLSIDRQREALQSILSWTNGQPFLTQKICQMLAMAIAEDSYSCDLVDRLVEKNIINDWESQDNPEHLITIGNRILYSEATSVRVLGIYQQILTNGAISRNNSFEQIELLLSGIAIDCQGYLVVKNLIYQNVFNLSWVEAKLSLLRPYSLQLKEWVYSNRQDRSQLLQGAALDRSLAWSRDKQLADLDYQYLSASQELAIRKSEHKLSLEKLNREKVELALEVAVEANTILAIAKKIAKVKTAKFKLRKTWLGIIVFLITTLIISVRYLGWLQSWELSAFDRLVRMQSKANIVESVVAIAIDERDIQQFESYPISDEILATAINNLKGLQPAAIGLDIYRDLPVAPGTKKLEQVFKSTPNLWGIEKLVKNKVNSPKTLDKLNRVGFNDLILDRDGRVRRALLAYNDKNNETKYSLSLQLALQYLAKFNIKPEPVSADTHQIKLGKAIFTPLKHNDGGYVDARTKGYQILLNYQGDKDNFKTYSLRDLLSNKIPRSAIQDRLVILGVTAESINDSFATPYSSQRLMPGVFIHANIISHILQAALFGKGVLKVLPEASEWLWILVWALVGSIASYLCITSERMLIASTMAMFTLLIVSDWAFLSSLWLPVIPAALALILAAIATKLVTEQQKSKIELEQILTVLLSMAKTQPAAVKIAIEYLKQGENEAGVMRIENLINR